MTACQREPKGESEFDKWLLSTNLPQSEYSEKMARLAWDYLIKKLANCNNCKTDRAISDCPSGVWLCDNWQMKEE